METMKKLPIKHYQKQYKFEIGTGEHDTWNNESDAFKALWENHIEGVVREYLRGLDKDDKFLIELKNAYYGDKEPKKPGVNGENPTEGTDKELGESGNG